MAQWLAWTVNEFSLKSVDFEKFCMNGATLCGMGKERFLDLAPDFVGDILWEHLEMLQKGEALQPPSCRLAAWRRARWSLEIRPLEWRGR